MKDKAKATLLARRSEMDAWFATHLGVISLEQLLRIGYSRSTVYRMAKLGELDLLLPGVFKGSQWPTGRDQLMAAACVRNATAAICSVTSAEMWAFRRVLKDPLIHILVPHSCSAEFGLQHEKFVIHRCRQIDPVDIVRRTDGIRLISPTRTALDIADIVLDSATGSILEQLINDDRGTMATHTATLARLGHPRRPGTLTMGRVIASRPTWRKAMQSDLETRVLAEIADQGLPLPELQYVVIGPNGQRFRFDFAWPKFREALEVDHPFWHAGASESHLDKRRDRKLGTVGWHTTRITDFDVRGNLREAIGDVATILHLATRRADLSPTP